MNTKRMPLIAFFAAGLTVALSGCGMSSFGPSQRIASSPQNLPPVENSSVQSSSLPPLQGQDGLVTADNSFNPGGEDPLLAGQQTASADGSFVTLNDFGGATTPAGRDLSGELTAGKLLGAWTVVADLQQCRLNLTQTNKSGTNRFRASAPGCAIPVLALVTSWQLSATQVQLFDESGAIVGVMQLNGNRFVGTLSGGVSVTMEG